MRMGKSFNKVEISHDVQEIAIDSFYIPLDAIAAQGYSCLYAYNELRKANKEELATQSWSDYLSMEALKEVASIKDEATIVMDIQVGKGKTSCCYDLIKEYASDGDKVILMVSPFKKLVEKDYDALTERNLSVFNYMHLPKGETYDEVLAVALNSKVHIMTVNCLLGNAGDDSFAQAFIKSNYLSSLHDKCKTEHKKVMIFFDEIHEAIHNFAPHLFPNLYHWTDVVQKCFVSSATFTVAVYPVLKYIALLTNKTIVEFAVPRHKWDAKYISKLHLHITTDEYSSGKLAPLTALRSILQANNGKQVNILSAHKSIIKALLKPKDVITGNANPFYEAMKLFNFNEVHGDTDNVFDETGNNIGTTFKTGVNVDNADSALIIILPVVKQNAPDSIFHDGVPSIIQALARQRKGGNIHIIMYDPLYLIEPNPDMEDYVDEFGIRGYSNFETYKPLRARVDAQLTANKAQRYHIDQHKALNILHDEYMKRYRKNAAHIDALKLSEAKGETQTGFQYPSFEQYVTEEGAHLLVKNYPQFGGDLSSYVLWAAMNSQFVNANLASISYYTQKVVEIKLSSTDLKASLIKTLPDGTMDMLKRASLKTVREIVDKQIETSTWVTMDGDKEITHNALHKFFLDDRAIAYTTLINDHRYLKTLLAIAADVNGMPYSDDELKEQYLLHSMAAATSLPAGTSILVDCYTRLHAVQHGFIQFCKAELVQVGTDFIIHTDTKGKMPIGVAEEVQEIATILQKEDPFIKSRAISFLQDIDEKQGDKLTDAVYKELRDTFTNISNDRSKRRSYNGEEKKYAPVIGTLEKPLPTKPLLYLM